MGILGGVKAVLSDRDGAAGSRARPYLAIVPAVLALAVVGGVLGTWSPSVAFLALAAPALAAVARARRTRPERVELALGPGHVDVKAPARPRRFGAREVRGASTAATPSGDVVLTVAFEGRRAPTTFRVADEAAAEELRRALGIGHGGVGRLAWHPLRRPAARAGAFGRIALAGLGVLYAAAFASTENTETATLILGLSSQVLIVAIAGVLADAFPRALGEPPAGVEMSAEGVRVQTALGPETLPYPFIQDVRIEEARIVFVGVDGRQVETPRTRSATGLDDDAAEAMRAQIVAAAARARGFGRPKQELAQRLEQLRRDPHRESPRDWLVRLDAAGRMLRAGPGYRGQAMDPEDLWTALEDPEADGEIRAAAARVLRSSGAPEARVRIDAAMAATRDVATQERLRVAGSEHDPDEEDLVLLAGASQSGSSPK